MAYTTAEFLALDLNKKHTEERCTGNVVQCASVMTACSACLLDHVTMFGLLRGGDIVPFVGETDAALRSRIVGLLRTPLTHDDRFKRDYACEFVEPNDRVFKREDIERARSLPKPKRVEKWQRWLDHQGTERVVRDVSPIRALLQQGDGATIAAPPEGIPVHWYFLGYAKPDKVEVGQKWRFGSSQPFITTICDVDEHWAITDGGRRYGLSMRTSSMWEYLGMVDGLADATPQAKPLLAKPSRVEVGQKWRYRDAEWLVHARCTDDIHEMVGVPVGHAVPRLAVQDAYLSALGEYLGTVDDRTSESAMTSPADVAAMAKGIAEYCTRDNAAKHNKLITRGIIAMLTQWLTWTRDPRLQNELAAKRLIANPPPWAYPTAWTCAVLAAQEYSGTLGHRLYIARETLETWARLAHRGLAVDVRDGLGAATHRAYARGMEKPTGLLQRPRNVMRVK